MLQKYQPLNLTERLQTFRSQKFTGLICCQGSPGLKTAGPGKYFLSFLRGEINYGGAVAPDVAAIAQQLSQNLNQPFFEMGFRIAQEQCKGSSSPREILSKLTSTRIVTWERIESVMQSQAEAALKVIAQAPGVITSEPEAGTDLCFGPEGHCLDWASLQNALGSSLNNAPSSLLSDAPSQTLDNSPSRPSDSKASSETDAVSESQAISNPNAGKQAIAPQPQANLPTVLSVDDSPIVQKMIQRALSPSCNVLLANNALLALQMLNKESHIALVLLDVNMPGISGLDFCRTIRGIPKFRKLPIIMLTANEGRVSKAMGQIAGSTLYLTKPVDNQELIRVVQQYTQSPEIEKLNAELTA